ncbi:hypothetical protein ACQP2U_10400 [Nocardia sp. CA-084685]|uniref:hypothetical protein n=1 Tax=Nocardia sp. CA-084685 TaxID=3239970 RepID=UPI003D97F5A5
MGRVPWAALDGDEVEAVVSNLLYNEHNRAKRIRPSQGDFGIDIIVPRQGQHGEVWDVYQVKKFALNLSGDQKAQVEKSFRRLMFALVRKGIPVGDWYLVMPLNPTTDNLEWFEAMPDSVIADMFAENPKLPISAEEKKNPLTPSERTQIEAWRSADGRIIDWKGLNACEAWVSNYWYVVDYYLEGGSQRIRNAVAEVAKLLQRDGQLADDGDQTALLTPAELEEHLLRLQSTLDGDPHFRYGVSLDPHVPDLANDAGLTAATQRVAADGSCLTFRIYLRFDEALNERPIPIKLKFAFDDPRFDQSAYERWRKYGTPLDAPAAAEINLPGGLGDVVNVAWVSILPADGRTHEMRLRVRADDGAIGAEVKLTMTTTVGPDQTGIRSHGRDSSGLLLTEGNLDLETNAHSLQFSLSKVSGAEIGEAWPAIALAGDLVHPNVLQIAAKYGPFHDVFTVPDGSQVMSPNLLQYLRALWLIQSCTSTSIRIPSIETVTVEEWRAALHSATLIEGQVAVGSWAPFNLESHIADQIDRDSDFELMLIGAHKLSIGGQAVTLTGTVTQRMLSASLGEPIDGHVRVFPHLNDTCHRSFDPSSPPIEGQYQVLYRRNEDQSELTVADHEASAGDVEE